MYAMTLFVCPSSLQVMLGLTAQLRVVFARLEETELRSNSFCSTAADHRCSTTLAGAEWKREGEGGDCRKGEDVEKSWWREDTEKESCTYDGEVQVLCE